MTDARTGIGSTEDALEHERRLLATVLQATDVMLVYLDRDFNFVSVNPAYAETCRMRPEEMVGKNHFALYPNAENEAIFRRVVATGESVFFKDKPFQFPDQPERGTTYWDWSLVPVKDAHGTVDGLVFSLKETTKYKRAEEALVAAHRELEESARRKDEFIAILSHELRNPLAPVRFALPQLAAQPLDTAGQAALEVVARQTEHLARLVDDLLDVSRITRGKIELRRERVTLSSVLDEAAEAAGPELTRRRHTLTTRVEDGDVRLFADRSRLAQIVSNLLDNSAKYTPPGGHISLDARREGAQAVIRVRDNGIGIPGAALETVFELFRQVEGAGQPQGGLGIGLGIVKQLVELHGGTVEARSAGPGTGAEFIVRLPLAAEGEDVEAASPHGLRAPSAGPRLRVLVVDDNADLVEMLALVVETAGHEVWKACDGPGAVSAARACRPDVVLLDLGLPGMSGFDVAQALRAQPELAHCHLVALTGWGQADDRQQTRDAGFAHHLTKPANPETVVELLARLAAGRITSAASDC